MATTILITLSALLLLAYFFDLTSRYTRIPSVILLLLVGWGLQQVLDILGIALPDLAGILPVLGTLGLILIVLEGALELKINASKKSVIIKSAVGAGLSALLLSLGIGLVFYLESDAPFKDCVSNALPLSVISSSIAIPAARNLAAHHREFVVYETSLSDIIGIIMFNFVVLNEVIDGLAVLSFSGQLALMIVLSLAGSWVLAYMLRTIQHPIKFIPMILWVVLLYELTKLYHLPSLLFILVFGLMLGNLGLIDRLPVLRRFSFSDAKAEVVRFHELIGEMAFLVRSLFFLLFGYTVQTAEILDPGYLVWSALIFVSIYLVRGVQLSLSGFPLTPLLFIAPRGLITLLLFLSIPTENALPLVGRPVLIQIIVLTALVMAIGLVVAPGHEPTNARKGSGKPS